jgi:ABC-type proline/glycine betaine transport system permease subunit
MSLFPYAVLLQVTPIVAIAPLIIIWVRDTRVALVLCAVVVAIFPIISNTTLGLRSVDQGLLNLFRMCRASRWQVLTRLRIPSALPYFFGGLRIASGLSLIGAVVAEFVAGTGGQGAGLAYQILLAGMQLNVPRLFAALFLIAVSGVALFAATVAVSRAALSSTLARERGPLCRPAKARRAACRGSSCPRRQSPRPGSPARGTCPLRGIPTRPQRSGDGQLSKRSLILPIPAEPPRYTPSPADPAAERCGCSTSVARTHIRARRTG